MATAQQLEEGIRRAYEMGRMDDARILGEELVRMRGEAVMPETVVTADVSQELPIEAQMAAGQQMPGQMAEPGGRGFFGEIAESFTGRERSAVPEVQQALTEGRTIYNMPETNQMSVALLKAALGGVMASSQERAQIFAANFPGMTYRQDEQGTVFMRSPTDGKEYVIEPGATIQDPSRAIATAATFIPAGRATTVLGAAGRAAATQTGIEASQVAAGGAFDPFEVAIAGATGAAFPAGQTVGRAAIQRPPLPDVVGSAQREGVRLMTSDVLPPDTFMGKIAQATGERIPLSGTGGMRATQQQQRIDAVKTLLNDYGATDYAKLGNAVLEDLVSVKKAEIQKYTASKADVINRLRDKGNVPVPRALKVLDEQIAELSSRRTPAADEAAERLKEIKATLPDRNLFQIEAYRADELSKVFMDDARPMSAAARDIGEKAVRKIYDPVREDMKAFVKSTGQLRDLDKFMVANARLSEGAKDVRNAALKRVLTKGDENPEVIQNLLFKGKPSEVRALYQRLTPQGKANARAAVLAKAGADASRDIGMDSVISPTVFANNVKKMGDSVGVLFTGDDIKRVEGLTRVLNLTRRAGEAAAAPPTGVQTTPFLIGSLMSDFFSGAGGVSVLKAVGTASGLGTIARTYESAPVRNLLLRIQQTKPGSFAEDQIFRSLQVLTQTERQLAE